jgi:hypothetical protein
MNREMIRITRLLRRNKKWIVVGGLGLVTTVFVGIGVIGFAIYHSGMFLKNSVVAVHKSGVNTVIVEGAQSLGAVETVLMNVASSWMHQNLMATDTAGFRAGLSCIDSIGGPSPKQMIDFVKTKVDDVHVLTALDEVGASVGESNQQSNFVASCASWISSG